MKRMFRVVLAFVVVAWGLTLPAMETVSAQVATITPTATDTNPLAGKTAAWTRRVTVGQNENVEVSVYKDFAYGTRGDASDEGEGYEGHEPWYMDDARGGGAFHRHRSGQYFDVFVPSNRTATSPVLIYLHGGSWSQCYDKDGTSLDMLASIAAKGYVVITADYILQNDITEGGATSLREGATFTAMLQDIDTLVTYLTRFLPAMDVTPTKLAIGGVSAGGHLSSLYAYDQAMPERLGLNLAHAIPVAVELDLVGPTDLGNLTENISLEAMRQLYGENAERVLAMFTALFEGVTGTTTLEAAAEQMELFSPLALVCAQSPATIAAYSELTDANGNGTGTDGAVRVSDFHGLTNALAAAGVNCKARLNMGVAHGELDNPSVAPASVEWIVASMDQALKAGWYDVADENQDPDDPPPSDGLKMADFAKKFTVTLPADFSGTLTGFPLLVRISPARISGFTYADIKQAGADIAAVDAEGNFLPTELQRYDATGESLLWVKVPEAKAGSTVTILYGTEQSVASLPQATALWSDYAGVWHMDEDSGTVVKDSAGVQDGAANGKSSVVTAAVLGAGRTMGKTTGTNGACVTVPKTDRLDSLGSTFTVSGWVNFNAAANWGYFFTRKTSDAYASWGVQCGGSNGVADQLRIWSNGTSDGDEHRSKIVTTGMFPQGTWVKYTFVYQPTTVDLYVNGVHIAQVAANPGPAVNGSNGFGIGGFPTTENHATLPAQHDEIKLCARAVDANWAKAEYEQEKGTLALVYGEALVTDASAPVIGGVSALVAADGTVTVSVAVTDGEGTIGIAYNADEATARTLGTISATPATFTDSPVVPAGAIWSVSAWGVSPSGTQVVKTLDGGVMNAAVTVAKTQDADENGLKPGILTLSRPASAADLPLEVNLVWTSDGEAGVDYVADLPSVVTIPAGETSALLTVTPIMNGDKKTDTAMAVTVAPGAYISGAAAELAIKNLEVDADFNTWIAAPESDGLASTAANWSKGVPQAGQNILFDGRFSTKDCMWDGGVNGLTDSVATWTQRDGYTGQVAVATKYPEVAGATFTTLTVSGDMLVDCGSLTQVSNDVQKEEYRLNVRIGGNLTVGASGSIDVTGRGPRGVMSGRAENVHAGDQNTFQKTYGDPKRPYYCGSGNNGAWPTNYKGAGGGAVWIEVAGTATVNGKILSEGSLLNSNMDTFNGTSGNISTSGGSVYLKAAALVGDGTGLISAKCEYSCNADNKIASAGRVAIELTETAYDFDGAAVQIKANSNAKQAGSPGHGTIVIRNPGEENGTLYVLGKHDRTFSYNNCEYTRNQTTSIPAGETWTFDKVVVGDFGMISVGPESTLELPNGWESVHAKNKNTDNLKKFACGIIDRGGTFVVPAKNGKHTFTNGNWTFHPTDGRVLDADTEVSGGASIGAMYLSAGADMVLPCDVKVTGDLDIQADGFMNANFGGIGGTATFSAEHYAPFIANDSARGSGHGGQNAIATDNVSYGSFFSPMLPGTAAGHADYRYVGGGVIKLEVTGTLNVDGKIQSCSGWDGQYWADRPSAPGSVNITATALTGSGTIRADGAAGYVGTYPRNGWHMQGPSGGGRVAVRLTGKTAAFDDAWFAKITAKGVTATGTPKSDTVNTNLIYSSAGSVYLQTAKDGEKKGMIYIRNDGKSENVAYTSIPVAAEGDSAKDLRHAAFSLLDCANVRFFDSVTIGRVVAGADSRIDLNGQDVVVAGLKSPAGVVTCGTYSAAKGNLPSFVSDSVGTGSLTVSGSGFFLVVR